MDSAAAMLHRRIGQNVSIEIDHKTARAMRHWAGKPQNREQ